MKLKICLLALLCLNFQSRGQSLAKVTGLNVGDQVPDITINNIFNYPGNSATISSFKHKLVILDFWATWCAACIAHLPETYAIQKQFSDKVQVFLVNSKYDHDPKDKIVRFLDKRKEAYQFPCVIGDTTITGLFPHSTIPHYVIIRDNKVLAITDAEHVTVATIDRIINESGTILNLKRDVKIKKDQPLFFQGNGGEMPKNYYRTVITGRLPVSNGVNRLQADQNGLINRIIAVNVEMTSLYYMAYPELPAVPEYRIIFDFPHPERFIANDIDSTARRVFSYESTFPSVNKYEALQNMRADLKRYFQVQVDTVSKETACYILRVNYKKPPTKVRSGVVRESNITEKTNQPKFFHDYSVESLLNLIDNLYNAPFINETSYLDNISLDLPSNILDEKAFADSLKKQGFLLTTEKRKIIYVVFRQLNVSQQTGDQSILKP